MKIEKTNTVYDVTLEEGDRHEPCPFCGDTGIELCHTWTASYWLECDGCGAEVHDIGQIGHHMKPSAHLASARRVLKRWNGRAS